VEKRQNISDKFNDFIINHFMDLIIVFACAVYVLRGLIQVTETGKTIVEIVVDGVIAWVFAYSISRMMVAKGLMTGQKTETYKATMSEYGKVIDLVTPHIDKLPDWCVEKNEKAKKRLQTNLLISAAIKYDTFISDDFDPSKYTDEKRKIIDKARKLKIKELSPQLLTSERKQKADEPFNFGMSADEYMSMKAATGVVFKVLISLVLGYYGVKLITDFSIETLIWYLVQVGIFMLFGSVGYLFSYLFATGALRNRFIAKTNVLYEFLNETKRKEEKPEQEPKAEQSAQIIEENKGANEQ
jgi:hypothetical protein